MIYLNVFIKAIYITPTSLIAELQPDFYDPVFSFGNDELIEGSLIKFSKNNKHYRGYKVGGNKFLGYYNEVNGTIEKNLLYPSTLDNLLNITIPYFCEEECQHEKIDLDFSGVTLSGDGGILLPIQSNILDARFEISFAETKEWFLSLVQHYKGKEQDVFGNLSFTYPQFFEGKHILVKDVYLGNQHYDFIGILFPDFNNTANTFAINEVVKDFGEGYGDYNNALIFDFVPDIRITCFKDLNNNCKRTRPSYIVNYENPGTLIATQSDIQNSNLQNYLNYESDNLLLFVNGYRMNLNLLNDYDRIPYGSIEFNNTYKYAGFCQDSGTYWDELSRLFVDRIGEENAIFIDGHNSINTSNHNDSEDTYKSKLKFASSLYQSICSMPDGVNNNVGLELIDELLEAQTCKGCNEPLPNKCLPLNASPNEQGYTIRFDEGYNDGLLLWDDIASGKVDLKLENGKISGKIDIVAHSMGYAHAMGVVEALKTHLPEGSTLGRFYVIAPENGCSSSIDLSLFEEVWQYGTYGQDEIPPNDNITKVYHLDGVAPQCAVPGLSFDVTLLNNEGIPAYGRIPFNGETKHENFVDAHLGKNQEWILEIKNLKNGHVKNRN